MSTDAHALLSASGSHKWLHCTPSARLEETLPEQESPYANEGRLAHEIAELKLKKQYVEPMGPRSYNTKLKKLQSNPVYKDEMLKHTDTYVDYISGIVHGYVNPPYIAVEKKIDYGMYAPEGFGTCDCIIIGARTLTIVDFKYGKGVQVDAQNNPQMMLYALGAYQSYSMLFQIEGVRMAIVQPRIDNPISVATMSVSELLAWGESIKPVAQTAWEGKGEYSQGDWCRFCRAKAQCRTRAAFNMSLEEYNMANPQLLTNEEIGQILQRAQNLAKWVKDLEEYALREAISGKEIAGWKVVEGISKRVFANTDEAFAALKAAGIDEAMLYERKPITAPACETLLGKAKFNELLGQHVIKPPGKPALVLLSDKREPIKGRSAAEIFSEE